jgi:hypothetical protein
MFRLINEYFCSNISNKIYKLIGSGIYTNLNFNTACYYGYLDIVKLHFPNICSDDFEKVGLLNACKGNQFHIIKFLDKNISFDISFIFELCQSDIKLRIFKFYFNKVFVSNNFLSLILKKLCLNNNYIVFKYIILKYPRIINIDKLMKLTNDPLMIKCLYDIETKRLDKDLKKECHNGDLKRVKLIIQNGAKDINSGMLIACKNDHINIIRYLISIGANNFNNCFSTACFEGYIGVVKLLSTYVTDFTEGLEMATYEKNYNICKFINIKCNTSKKRDF